MTENQHHFDTPRLRRAIRDSVIALTLGTLLQQVLFQGGVIQLLILSLGGTEMEIGLISMDSTLRSNLSVGMPLDLQTIRRNEYRVHTRERIEAGDPTFAAMSEAWSQALRDGFHNLPE